MKPKIYAGGASAGRGWLAATAVLYVLPLIGLAFIIAYFGVIFYALGGDALDFVYALDPRTGPPTDFWLGLSIFVLSPVALGMGFVLAVRRHPVAALLLIPATVVVITAGGIASYLVDRWFM